MFTINDFINFSETIYDMNYNWVVILLTTEVKCYNPLYQIVAFDKNTNEIVFHIIQCYCKAVLIEEDTTINETEKKELITKYFNKFNNKIKIWKN